MPTRNQHSASPPIVAASREFFEDLRRRNQRRQHPQARTEARERAREAVDRVVALQRGRRSTGGRAG